MSKFFDTNILLYLVEYGPKMSVAEALLQKGGIVSVQVLNEFVDVCRRKHKMNFDDISAFLAPVKATLEIVDLTVSCHERAVEIAASTNVRIYDACILAAAELAGCDVLYTEDLNNGQRIGGVTIVNPFV